MHFCAERARSVAGECCLRGEVWLGAHRKLTMASVLELPPAGQGLPGWPRVTRVTRQTGSVVQTGEVGPVRKGREEGRSDRHFLPYFVLSPV